MDDLLIGLVRLVFVVIFGFFKLIFRGFRALYRLGDTEMQRRKTGALPSAQTPKRIATTRAAPAKPSARVSQNVTDALRKRAAANIESTRALSERAGSIPGAQRFVSTLDAMVERDVDLDRVIRRGQNDGGSAERALARDERLREIVEVMVAERSSDGLATLLRDTDALATASYAPIVEYCGRRGIALTSDRAATVVDGDKLFFLSVDDPTGLAAIVLPEAFSRELIWWPAIAHEIAHDFYRSVAGLPDDLQRALKLDGDTRLPAFTGNRQNFVRALAAVPGNATTAWREELFADAFGTMMLGPAYVLTMSQLFADEQQPTRALAMGIDKRSGVARYEEHPPGHVRVVAACRLLGRMAYGAEADRLEASWRKRHGNPESVYVPLADERYVTLPEEPVLAEAARVGEALYMTGMASLRQQPLRSIAGLDFGPREHEQARRASERLQKGRAPEVRDPRVLVAGAVLARVAQPARRAQLYALARMAMAGLVNDDEDVQSEPVEGIGVVDATAVREALILDALLGPPPSLRGRSPIRRG